EGVTTRSGTANFNSGIAGDTGGTYATPGYVATSNYKYTQTGGALSWSVNPDGLMFPNHDHNGTVTSAADYSSCSATVPIVESPLGSPNLVRLLTTHTSRSDKITLGTRDLYLSELHIQPIDPWIPNYIEDTSFQACAPVSDPYLEPPLHFYKKDSNTMAWCTEPYPNQNPYWYQLNNKVRPTSASGTVTANLVNWPTAGAAPVKAYTSHADGAGLLDGLNTCTGTNVTEICAATGNVGGCTTYLPAKSNTCDRTVSFDSNQAYFGFPLQAADADIEKMLSDDLIHDKSFSCQYSVNPDSNKVNAKMPASACCGVVNGVPLLSALLTGPSEVRNASGVITTSGAAGHLEPYTDATVPNIRFCGSPVQ
ncbi:MAG: hypothetical protein JWL77_6945, partial [Chthonomonadaceae bacterium]|nr:hypothetical protein [Chthonomonadaceae bacterium]